MTAAGQLGLGVDRGANLSECGTYRYTLWRRWEPSRGAVLFVMLNPSTADAEQDDNTIRRCIGFARDWGYGGLLVGNLYAFRATKPADLAAAVEPVGPDNDSWLLAMKDRAQLVIAAWGTHPMIAGRAAHVMDMLGGLHVLRLTKKGDPGHPLYVPKETRPTRWTHA